MSKEKLLDEQWEIRYRADYSSRYHRKRSAFLSRWDTVMTAFTLAAGAAAVGDMADNIPSYVLRIGAVLVAAISIIQITTKIADASFQHREWMKRWVRLGLDVKQVAAPTARQISNWESEIASIEADCVVELRALRIICEDESARFYDLQGRQHKIWLIQRFMANFGTFQPNIERLSTSEALASPPSPEHPPTYP